MRCVLCITIFLYAYIEISIFIQIAHTLGVLLTLLLVIFTSVIGISLVRLQGLANFIQMQQKMQAGESPTVEIIKSMSLIISGLLLILPGFFTDFLALLLLLLQKHLILKLIPHFRCIRIPGWDFSVNTGSGNTFEGEFQRKNDCLERKKNDR